MVPVPCPTPPFTNSGLALQQPGLVFLSLYLNLQLVPPGPGVRDLLAQILFIATNTMITVAAATDAIPIGTNQFLVLIVNQPFETPNSTGRFEVRLCGSNGGSSYNVLRGSSLTVEQVRCSS